MPSSNEPSKRLWVTGAEGFLGRYFVQAFTSRPFQWNVISLTRNVVDLTDHNAVRSLYRENPPFAIVHCAALADAAQCESRPEQSFAINVESTRVLADLADEESFVYLSTDLVFDGSKGHYHETDAPNPLHVYGQHKLAAEAHVLENPRHTVIRTSLNAGTSRSGHRSFNESMKHAWTEHRAVTLFRDEFRNPIAASLTARASRHLLEHQCSGLYHVAGRERLSRLEMGFICRDHYQLADAEIVENSLQTYSGPRRAPDTSLNCDKAQAVLPFPLLGLKAWLSAHPNDPFA